MGDYLELATIICIFVTIAGLIVTVVWLCALFFTMQYHHHDIPDWLDILGKVGYKTLGWGLVLSFICLTLNTTL